MIKKHNIILLSIISALTLNSFQNTQKIKAFQPGDSVISLDFENTATASDIIPMGIVTLNIDTANGNNSNSCLRVTNRTQAWNGAGFFDHPSIIPGNTYDFKAHVFHYSENPENILCTMKTTTADGSTSYNTVAKVEMPSQTWTEITGTFTVPPDALQYAIYIESASGVMDICIDDVNITLVANAEPVQSEITSEITQKATPAPEENTTKESIKEETEATVQAPAVSDPVKTEITEKKSEDNHDKNDSSGFTAVLVIIIILILLALLLRYLLQNNKLGVKSSKSLDPMTKAFKKEEYNKKIEALTISPSMYKELYVAVCDVSFVGQINEIYGYSTGDEAIIRCAGILMSIVGRNGKVYRTDANRFVCISNTPFRNKIENEFELASKQNYKYPFFVASGFSFSRDDTRSGIKALIGIAENEMLENKNVIRAKNAETLRKFKIDI
ncbi:MAG: diguanylate cyclase [Ruminococcus sp.]|nr:diguanylate cyclase [Ruminococcus sp.]